MPESRKNHLIIDGGQVKEDDHISTYKPIPESDTGFPASKITSKSRDRLPSDGAEEKLLEKSDNAKITTRVDMADAKYVVGDQRNGDAKIELDASKRFTGLTKEELQKYVDDPFWVRLRWFMFSLFWLLWLCMLAGAIAIIVKAPKCSPPQPKTWYQKGPLIDMTAASSVADLQDSLAAMKTAKVEGIFINGGLAGDTYTVLEEENAVDQIKGFINKAKEIGVKVIVDLTANFVSKTHKWFEMSENRTGNYTDYFVWAKATQYDDNGSPKPPNNWVSTVDTPAWAWSDKRKEFYLHRYGADQPDLNFTNPAVVMSFDRVLRKWMQAGADGIRLNKARNLVVNESLSDEIPHAGFDLTADHTKYWFWRHQHSSDQPILDSLMMHWSHVVDTSALNNPGTGNTIFTINEAGEVPELILLERNLTSLRPPSLAAIDVDKPAAAVAELLNNKLSSWPLLQLRSASPKEVAAFALLLPAAPVLTLDQASDAHPNVTNWESVSRVSELRHDASIEHGNTSIVAVTANNTDAQVLLCARWKAGHTGYAAVWNPTEADVTCDLSRQPPLPVTATLVHASASVAARLNFTHNMPLELDNMLVPSRSTIVISYVPKTLAEK